MKKNPPTLAQALQSYLNTVNTARSSNTGRTYQNAMTAFRATLAAHGLPTKTTPVKELNEDAVAWFAPDMKVYSPATERLYLTAVTGFYEYLVAEHLVDQNLPRG